MVMGLWVWEDAERNHTEEIECREKKIEESNLYRKCAIYQVLSNLAESLTSVLSLLSSTGSRRALL